MSIFSTELIVFCCKPSKRSKKKSTLKTHVQGGISKIMTDIEFLVNLNGKRVNIFLRSNFKVCIEEKYLILILVFPVAIIMTNGEVSAGCCFASL